jgi:hypothetical protein
MMDLPAHPHLIHLSTGTHTVENARPGAGSRAGYENMTLWPHTAPMASRNVRFKGFPGADDVDGDRGVRGDEGRERG